MGTTTGPPSPRCVPRTLAYQHVPPNNTVPHQVSTKDLLCWAYQVTRGMEYLASRKVTHLNTSMKHNETNSIAEV